MPTQMDLIRARFGGMSNMDTGYQNPATLPGNSTDSAIVQRDNLWDQYLRGDDVNTLGGILNQYQVSEADRLQGQLPGLEQSYMDLLEGGVDYGQIGKGLEGATMGFLRQMFEKGGYFDNQTNIGLGNEIQSGRGIHSGTYETGRRTNENTMMGMTADRIAQILPQLYGTAGGVYGTQVQGMAGLLGNQSGRFDIFSGYMGMTNLRMTQEDRVLNNEVTRQNLWDQEKAVKSQGGIGGVLAGVAGGALGSFFGPLGTSIGSNLGSSLFGGGDPNQTSFTLPTNRTNPNLGSLHQTTPFFGEYGRRR